jgi:hypothetical protein
MALTPKRPTSVGPHKVSELESHKATRAVARLSVDVPAPLLRELKILAAKGDTTIQRIVLRLIERELLESNEATTLGVGRITS